MAEIKQLTGDMTLRVMYPEVNKNITNVNAEIVGHKASEQAHAADAITYNGNVPAASVKEAIDKTDSRISEIVAQAGDSNTEIVDARGGAPVLGERLNGLDEQLADTKTELDDATRSRAVSNVIKRMINGDAVIVVCYGDSMTFGYTPGTGVKTANPYPETLQKVLRKYYNNNNITVYNEGVSSITSAGLASDSNILNVTRHAPHLTIVMAGINDNLQGVDVSQYKENLRLILTKINSAFVLLSPTPYYRTSGGGDLINRNRILEYVKAAGEIALQFNADFVNTFDAVNKDMRFSNKRWTDIFGDDLHFVDSYYQRFANMVFAKRLCNVNILIDKDTNINTYDAAWQFAGTYSYYAMSNNPQVRNVILKPGAKATVNIFIDAPGAKVYLRCPTGTNVPAPAISTKVTVDDAIKNCVPLNSDFTRRTTTATSDIFWDERFYITELPYGLHTLIIENSGSSNDIFLSSLEVEIADNQKSISSKAAASTSSRNKIVDNSLYSLVAGASSGIHYSFINNYGGAKRGSKIKITLNPSGDTAGICLGSHYVVNDETLFKTPKFAIYTTNGVLMCTLISTGGSSDNLPSPRFFHVAKTGNEVFNFNTENTILIEYTNNGVSIFVNDQLSLTLTYDEFLVGDLDVWMYAYNANSKVEVTKVEIIS